MAAFSREDPSQQRSGPPSLITTKQRQGMRFWRRLKERRSWLLVLGVFGPSCAHVLFFLSKEEAEVRRVWGLAEAMVLLHKFLLVPLVRGLVLSALTIRSKSSPFADFLLLLHPSWLPMEKLPVPGSKNFFEAVSPSS